MPPKEEARSFTFITGNPRSKKNITQIRRHAGQNSGHKAINHPTSNTFLGSDNTPLPISHSWNPRQYVPVTSPAVVERNPPSVSAQTSLNSYEALMGPSFPADIMSPRPLEVPMPLYVSENREPPLFFSSTIQHPNSWACMGIVAESQDQDPIPYGQSRAGPASSTSELPPKASSPPYMDASSTKRIRNDTTTSSRTTGEYLHTHISDRAIPNPVQCMAQNGVAEEIVTGSTIIEASSPPISSVETRHPPRKLTIRDLMNECDVEDSDSGQTDDSQHLLAANTSTSRPTQHPIRPSVLKDPRGILRTYEFQLPHTLQDVTRVRRPAMRRKHERHSNGLKHDDHDHHAVLKPSISKKRKQRTVTAAIAKSISPARDMKPAPWRIESGPSSS